MHIYLVQHGASKSYSPHTLIREATLWGRSFGGEDQAQRQIARSPDGRNSRGQL